MTLTMQTPTFNNAPYASNPTTPNRSYKADHHLDHLPLHPTRSDPGLRGKFGPCSSPDETPRAKQTSSIKRLPASHPFTTNNTSNLPFESLTQPIPLLPDLAETASVPNITLHLSSHPIMEPSWQHQQGFYYADRPNAPQHHNASPQGSSQDDGPAHRRALTHPTSSNLFPPPPPPSQSASTQIGLPPFNSGFYSPHYSSSGGAHSASTSAPASTMQYPGHASGGTTMAAPSTTYPYPVTSPMSHHVHPLPIGRGPSHSSHFASESPRMHPGPPAPWSTSPGFHHLSPTSPTTQLIPPGMPASSSTSSSSFPSVTRTPGHLPGIGAIKKRSGSVTHSNESWDDEKYGPLDEMGEETEDQPWGMPQDEYKALNPRDKKQVRNRIGARRFRAKRKNYVSNLEGSIRSRDDEIARLRAQVDQHRVEINDLRGRLGIPPMSAPPPPPAPLPSSMESGLGLVVNHTDGWDESKSEL